MPNGKDSEGTTTVANAILAYLVAHPAAQDTSEGILQWWLLPGGVQCQLETVQRALEQLVAEKMVTATRASDQRVHYRLSVDPTQEARRRIRSEGGPPA
jgi:Fe2+ or Zn2+ uptake regulation protein